ncbi:MAG: O-antigen ligase family protein [Chloroflexota bacterium]|nr:O-antigen ligase family protein [Chloroflexota bacterium]
MKQFARWVAEREILIAPVVALFLIFPTQVPTLTIVGLVGLVGVWLLRWGVQGYPLRRTPLNLALLPLLMTVPVAVWASADHELTTVALAYLLAGVIVFHGVAHWTHAAERVWWIWGGLVAVGLTLVVLAPLGMLLPQAKLFPLPALYTRWADRLPETINANVIAGSLVVLWPISLAGIQLSGQRSVSHNGFNFSLFTSHVLRLVAALSGLLLLATLVLTQSRGAYVGFAIGALVLLGLRWPRAALVVIPLVVIAALAGVELVGWRTVADQLMTGEATSGLDNRIEIWSRAIYAIQDFPFTGVGLGTFERVVAVLYPLFLHPEGTVPHAHNLYLQVAVDLGLPGLVAYLALLGLSFATAFSAYRVFRRGGQGALAMLCAGCVAGLTGMCIHGLVDAVTWGTKLALVPWAVMGLVVGLHGVAGEDEVRGEGGKGDEGARRW